MPHFLAQTNTYKIPYTSDGFEFCYKAKSLIHSNVALICVKSHKQVFFIQEIQRKNDILIKGLKITRPVPIGILKGALSLLAKQCHTLSHNLSTTKIKHKVKSPFLREPLEFYTSSLFTQRSAKIHIEIGFGSGRHILDLAHKNPNDYFIGLEIHTPSIEQVLRQIELLGLQNLFIINFDARILVEILPSNCIDSLYIHFPVPWNTSHHRRVISAKFLYQSLRILKQGGFLELRSDDAQYFNDALSLALDLPKSKIWIHKNIAQDIISKYEARWRKKNKDIFDLRVFSLETHCDIVYNSEFNFDKKLVKSLVAKSFTANIIAKLTQKQIFEQGFLHVCDIYQDNNRLILIVSMGDFLLPINRVVVFEDESGAYFPQSLPPNHNTILAHNKFIELLENL